MRELRLTLGQAARLVGGVSQTLSDMRSGALEGVLHPSGGKILWRPGRTGDYGHFVASGYAGDGSDIVAVAKELGV